MASLHPILFKLISLFWFMSSDLFYSFLLALIPFGMGVLPFVPPILVLVTQPPPMEHPFASQLNSEPLCFMTEYLGLWFNLTFGPFKALMLGFKRLQVRNIH